LVPKGRGNGGLKASLGWARGRRWWAAPAHGGVGDAGQHCRKLHAVYSPRLSAWSGSGVGTDSASREMDASGAQGALTALAKWSSESGPGGSLVLSFTRRAASSCIGQHRAASTSPPWVHVQPRAHALGCTQRCLGVTLHLHDFCHTAASRASRGSLEGKTPRARTQP
jgi:hypothetical protein